MLPDDVRLDSGSPTELQFGAADGRITIIRYGGQVDALFGPSAVQAAGLPGYSGGRIVSN